MSNHPLVYIVVLNWNSYEDTTVCIQSLEASDYKNFKIVIVDNASQDGSEAILKNRFPQHFFIQTGRNRGYGDGNNFGIRHALKENADYLWIVNPDIRVEKESLSRMIELTEKDPRIGVAGPRLLWQRSKTVKNWIMGTKIALEKGFHIDVTFFKEGEPLPEIHDTDNVIGCSLLIKRKVLMEIGLFRDDFFMFHEESEFNLRVKAKGWKIAIFPQIINYHFCKDKQKLINFYLLRNAILVSRLQRKYRLRTILASLGFAEGRLSQRKIGWRGMLQRMPAVISGIVKPLKAPPRITL